MVICLQQQPQCNCVPTKKKTKMDVGAKAPTLHFNAFECIE
jgi:hypothetical protein